MPIKTGKATGQERAFVEAYAATGDRAYSATKAGYKFPDASATRIMQRPSVVAEIRRVQSERLFQEALPAAVDCLVQIVTGEGYAAGARVQASKIILDRTLGAEGAGEAKAPHEMTPEELQAALAKTKLSLAALESAKADRARPIIEVEPPANGDIFE